MIRKIQIKMVLRDMIMKKVCCIKNGFDELEKLDLDENVDQNEFFLKLEKGKLFFRFNIHNNLSWCVYSCEEGITYKIKGIHEIKWEN